MPRKTNAEKQVAEGQEWDRFVRNVERAMTRAELDAIAEAGTQRGKPAGWYSALGHLAKHGYAPPVRDTRLAELLRVTAARVRG